MNMIVLPFILTVLLKFFNHLTRFEYKRAKLLNYKLTSVKSNKLNSSFKWMSRAIIGGLIAFPIYSYYKTPYHSVISGFIF